MTEPTGTPPEGGGTTTATTPDKTFTQADLDRIVADRLARERGKYSDYDDLKKKAAEADSAKSDMDKVMEKLAAMEDKATKAERRALLAEVAGKTGLSMAKVERLKGDTVEDLLADAAEVFDAKPGSGGTSTTAAGEGDNGAKPDGTAGKTTGSGGGEGTGVRTRPSELREGSGAAPAGTTAEDMDKIADEVLGGR